MSWSYRGNNDENGVWGYRKVQIHKELEGQTFVSFKASVLVTCLLASSGPSAFTVQVKAPLPLSCT